MPDVDRQVTVSGVCGGQPFLVGKRHLTPRVLDDGLAAKGRVLREAMAGLADLDEDTRKTLREDAMQRALMAQSEAMTWAILRNVDRDLKGDDRERVMMSLSVEDMAAVVNAASGNEDGDQVKDPLATKALPVEAPPKGPDQA